MEQQTQFQHSPETDKTESSHYDAPIHNMVENATKDRTIGPLLASLLIILLIVVGGLYFWSTLIAQKKIDMQNPQVPAQDQEDSVTATGTIEIQVAE